VARNQYQLDVEYLDQGIRLAYALSTPHFSDEI
jgi:hypothetical protein